MHRVHNSILVWGGRASAPDMSSHVAEATHLASNLQQLLTGAPLLPQGPTRDVLEERGVTKRMAPGLLSKVQHHTLHVAVHNCDNTDGPRPQAQAETNG